MIEYERNEKEMRGIFKTAFQLGCSLPPQRRLITLSKDYYVTMTMIGNGNISLNIVNHWSWVREDSESDEDEDYITSLFIPGRFGQLVKDRVKAKL